jgi:hypothetical protein
MAGERIPGPLGRDPFAQDGAVSSGTGGFANPGPTIDQDAPDEPIELGTGPKISQVTKDWSDPPSVSPTFTPEVSGKTLKAVLVELQRLSEWGTGGGNLSAPGGGEIQLVPADDGKSYTVALSGAFFITLPKWKEYNTANAAQQKSWDAMIADLRKHEEEHVAIAYRGANQLVKDLKGLPVQRAGQKIADSGTKTQDQQDDFDSPSKTDHGKKDYPGFNRVVLDTSADP